MVHPPRTSLSRTSTKVPKETGTATRREAVVAHLRMAKTTTEKARLCTSQKSPSIRRRTHRARTNSNLRIRVRPSPTSLSATNKWETQSHTVKAPQQPCLRPLPPLSHTRAIPISTCHQPSRRSSDLKSLASLDTQTHGLMVSH